MGLFDYPGDLSYPMPAQRKVYNPSDYASLKGSGLLAALQSGAGAQNAQNAKMSGISGTPANYANENAQMMAQGAIQPWDEKQRQGQYNTYLNQMQNQDQLAQGMYNTNQAANEAQQQAIGGLVGTGLGAYLGYNSNNKAKNNLWLAQQGAN